MASERALFLPHLFNSLDRLFHSQRVLSTDNVLSLHEIASWRRFEAFDSVGRSRVTTVDVTVHRGREKDMRVTAAYIGTLSSDVGTLRPIASLQAWVPDSCYRDIRIVNAIRMA